MGSTEPLRTGQIVRYTDPAGDQWDAIIRDIDGEQAFIKYRPTWHDRHQWVDVDTLEIPE